jgi:hypothetical protein
MHCQACGRPRWGLFDGEQFHGQCNHITNYDQERNSRGWWTWRLVPDWLKAQREKKLMTTETA